MKRARVCAPNESSKHCKFWDYLKKKFTKKIARGLLVDISTWWKIHHINVLHAKRCYQEKKEWSGRL